uniref:Uncharacterized protein n=1 Tax=Mycena chlorophos TaxID=658473 RepID=A0ABQ0KUW3_MYCCL|nr:predicted protein [Mycena chlorophos]
MDAIKRFIDEVETGEIPRPKHIIVIYGSEPTDNRKWDGLGFVQAGEYSGIQQIGLVEFTKDCLRAKLAAREGKPEFKDACTAIKAEIQRILNPTPAPAQDTGTAITQPVRGAE